MKYPDFEGKFPEWPEYRTVCSMPNLRITGGSQWYKNWKHKEVLNMYLFYFLLCSLWYGSHFFLGKQKIFSNTSIFLWRIIQSYTWIQFLSNLLSVQVPQHHGATVQLEKGGDSVSPPTGIQWTEFQQVASSHKPSYQFITLCDTNAVVLM